MVVDSFRAGGYDIDRTRVYMHVAEAQSFFNKDGVADEIEVMVEDPEHVDDLTVPLLQASGNGALLWTWRDSAGAFLRALDVEDNVMFIILSILVLIAAMNIISGLIMLVKNKGRDIGILRTMGLTEGSVLRIFFICGASVGLIGTGAGVVLGCLFALYIENFDSYKTVYGALAGAAIYLIFLFLTCVALLVGAEVNEQWYVMRVRRKAAEMMAHEAEGERTQV